jgi:hypothetical protein
MFRKRRRTAAQRVGTSSATSFKRTTGWPEASHRFLAQWRMLAYLHAMLVLTLKLLLATGFGLAILALL